MTSRVQKILDLVERGGNNTGIGGLGGGVSDNTTLQLFNALNELKNHLQVKKNNFFITNINISSFTYFWQKILESKVRDHNFMKMMGDLRFESGKNNTRLGDIIKGKASRDKVRFHLYFHFYTIQRVNLQFCICTVFPLIL